MNWDKSGMPISTELSSVAIGFNNADKSGVSKDGASASFSPESFLLEELIPVISERSSSTGELSSIAAISGIPRTKSSESSFSGTPLGRGTLTGFSPRLARSVISSPRDRISLLNCLS